MKILTRDFTKREIVLLIILGITIIGALYYLFVYQTIETGITAASAQAEALENQLQATQAQVKKIQAMDEEMGDDAFKSYMPSYNASKQELDFMHSILASTEDYQVYFTYLTREGDQIKREFTLQYTANNYKHAEDIIEALENSEVRCLINDFIVTAKEREHYLSDDKVIVNLTGAFYETMFDGKADQELPEDKKVTETSEDNFGY